MRRLHAPFLALLLVLNFALAPSASANNQRYAAFVVDQNTGVVLHSRRSEAQRYPASLTKMMTLYMLFEAIEIGEIGLNDQIRVSANAASAPPSGLGLRSGDTIRVEDAILALVVKSANDVAVAVGERIGGGERAFADEMTSRAQALGLENTTFRNASGLPNSRQTTTAQDMARLAIALHRDFPQYFDYFDTSEFTYGGRTYRSHNSLVGRVNGVDGLKTGYIRASGFNVVVSAERGENRLIAVIMGGPTAAARDAHAEELLEAAFNTLEQRHDTRLFAGLTIPRLNPVREQAIIARDFAALGVAAPTEMGSAQAAPPLRVVLADEDEMAVPLAAPSATSPSERSTRVSSGVWSVQVGAYRSADQARERLAHVADLSPVLEHAQHAARSVDVNGQQLWRARFEALSAEDARQACTDFGQLDQACFAVAPGR